MADKILTVMQRGNGDGTSDMLYPETRRTYLTAKHTIITKTTNTYHTFTLDTVDPFLTSLVVLTFRASGSVVGSNDYIVLKDADDNEIIAESTQIGLYNQKRLSEIAPAGAFVTNDFVTLVINITAGRAYVEPRSTFSEHSIGITTTTDNATTQGSWSKNTTNNLYYYHFGYTGAHLDKRLIVSFTPNQDITKLMDVIDKNVRVIFKSNDTLVVVAKTIPTQAFVLTIEDTQEFVEDGIIYNTI